MHEPHEAIPCGTPPASGTFADTLVAAGDAVNRIGKPLEKIKGGENGDIANILLCLASEALVWYCELIGAVSRSANAPLAAICTRNLLEVAVWTSYCIASRNNAKRFMADAKRDVNGLRGVVKPLAVLLKAHSNMETWNPAMSQQLADIEARIDGGANYLPVRQAAESLGNAEGMAFSVLNKALSKLAHPTALVVSSVCVGEAGKELSELFLQLGSELFKAILTEIAKYTFDSPTLPVS